MLLAFALSALLTGSPREVILPPGTLTVDTETRVPAGFTLSGHEKGTVLQASAAFHGRAILVAESSVEIRRLTLDGNRQVLERPVEMAPSDRRFIDFYDRANGIIADRVSGLRLLDIDLRNISNFAVIVAASESVSMEQLTIADSGSRKPNGRNNTSGGILLEEGTRNFSVRRCRLKNIRGNGIWTHSRYTSPRNGPGVFAGNRFYTIGRDALQAGHAFDIHIRENTGTRIGYPVEIVDVEGGGTPVAVDTAGNVSQAMYTQNGFEEINGKCFDLDGLNRSTVSENVCLNSGKAEDYPFGHYGIVMNNTNPDMEAAHLLISGNIIDGTKFGGIFVIGHDNVIRKNTLSRINLARCNENAKVQCLYDPKQPDLLRAGIYLGAGAERPAPAERNTIADNVIEGYGMAGHCIAAAPGVNLRANQVSGNQCSNQTP